MDVTPMLGPEDPQFSLISLLSLRFLKKALSQGQGLGGGHDTQEAMLSGVVNVLDGGCP